MPPLNNTLINVFGSPFKNPTGEVESPGVGVALSNLDDIMASFSNGPGYLRDMRDNTGLFVDTGQLDSVDVSGDLVGAYRNQCTITGADSHVLTNTLTSTKFQWEQNKGTTGQTNINVVRANDVFVNLSSLRLDTLTTVFAVKASLSTTPLNSRIFGSSSSYYNITFKAIGDGSFAVEPYLSASFGNFTVTGDANDVMVVMTQWQPDNTLDIYVNNVLIGSPDISSVAWLAGQQANFNIHSFAVTDVTQEFLLGWAIVPGRMNSDQRQTYCDYFQQNGGVL